MGAVIVTVTLNAALDRTLTVPNLQLGQRHRASASLSLAGGKGINIAGGGTGARILQELAGEAILHDFVQIRDNSRTSTAVVDPMAGTYTEINEWGPQVEEDELEVLREKLRYLSTGADFVIFAGSLPRGVETDFYAEAIRDLARRGVQTVLDSEGDPLRFGVEAEPTIVSPNDREAEALVGQEFAQEEDFVSALDRIAEMGARNVLISQETGCYALLREERSRRHLHAVAPPVDVVSGVGAGDVLLAAFIAARLAGRSGEEALRGAVAAGTASTLEVGAGRFDAREAARLAGAVEVSEPERVPSS
jgi:1-phosphofructokinase family hexose kinase